ncbi:MAG: ankyrin repeat domain-containing protein [Planctomycetaceae bacterium]|jgi:ankyrin repeat protein|nr:ankyrin repeat domain-containing protein [Planctomycetaceae bacterium]
MEVFISNFSRADIAKHNRNTNLQSIRYLENNPKNSPYDAIVYASKLGEKEEFFRLFEKFNPDLSWTDTYNNDFLGLAVSGENINIVKFLVEKGCNINHQGRYNITPLIRSCMLVPQSKQKMRRLIEYLLEVGADVSLIDDMGHNALYYAKQTHYDNDLYNKLTPPITN